MGSAEQGLVGRLEPFAQALLAVMALADVEHAILDFVAGRIGGQVGEEGVEIAQRGRFRVGRRAALQSRRDEGAGIGHRQADQFVELGIGVGGGTGRVALDERPGRRLVGDAGQAGEVEQQPEADRQRMG